MMSSMSILKKSLSTVPLVMSLNRMGDVSPADITDFVFSNEIVRPLQVRSELLQFAELVARLRPRCVMEIGTCRGGTLLVMSRLSDSGATVISLDLPDSWIRGPLLKTFRYRRQSLQIVQGDSHSSAIQERIRRILKHRKIDLLFIDGDHSYEGVKEDFEAYMPFVQEKGVVAFHDIVEHLPEAHCDVFRFWNEIKKKYSHEEIIEDPRQGWAGIGVLYV